MDCAAIKRVVTLENDRDVNKYLEYGWTLLTIYTTVCDDMGAGLNNQAPRFILGWANGEPQYPQDDYSGIRHRRID